MTDTKKPSLWTLTADQQAAMDLIDELDGGEMTADQEAAFDAIFAELDTNTEAVVERLANFRAFLTAKAAAEEAWKEQYDSHVKRHRARRDAFDNRAKRIGERVREFGMMTGRLTCTEGKVPGKQIVAGPWKVGVQFGAQPKPKLIEGAVVPDEFCDIVKVPNMKKIQDAIDVVGSLPFVTVEERQAQIRFRSEGAMTATEPKKRKKKEPVAAQLPAPEPAPSDEVLADTESLDGPLDTEVKPSNSLFGDDPVAASEKMFKIVDILKEQLPKRGFISIIDGKQYPNVEAWTLLGALIGVTPVVRWTKEIPGGWEARVEAVDRRGMVVGAADTQANRSEWWLSDKPDHAIRSMAQTRATGKAMRGPFAFVMKMAGFEATPAEEMPKTGKPVAAPQPKQTVDIRGVASGEVDYGAVMMMLKSQIGECTGEEELNYVAVNIVAKAVADGYVTNKGREELRKYFAEVRTNIKSKRN